MIQLLIYLFSFSCLSVMATGLLCNSMLPVVPFCFRMFCKHANKKIFAHLEFLLLVGPWSAGPHSRFPTTWQVVIKAVVPRI